MTSINPLQTLIDRSMRQCGKAFYDAFSDEIYKMVYRGCLNNILHNPRLVMYKLMGQTHNGITITKGTEKKISGVINVMKYYGEIKNHWTIDTTRSITGYDSYVDKEEALTTLADSFYLDRWATQPRKVLLMCEASGYLGVIKNIADTFRVPFVPAKGDMSVQLKMEIADSLQEPTTILYYGDYDVKGLQIPKTIENDIRAINPVAEFNLHRMFLNLDDIERYDLAMDEKGQVQLEQLDASIAIERSKEVIWSLIDEEVWDNTLAEEETIRETLRQ